MKSVARLILTIALVSITSTVTLAQYNSESFSAMRFLTIHAVRTNKELLK